MTVTRSPGETEALGRRIGAACRGGEVLLLSGDLGAGKTCLTKGIAQGLGIDPGEVTSPTFTLLQLHRGRLPLYHIDLYRVERPDEIAHLELFEELEGPGVTVVEWPAQGGPYVPSDALRIRISSGATNQERTWDVALQGDGPAHLLQELERGAPSA